ncbi:MAG: carboxypeptidase regulatory-like domain-containing protein [Planctomycetes bacterium]|nr:carboxypeptidase regulatory-like domain-containing protein [Planctomycetota bacterium]
MRQRKQTWIVAAALALVGIVAWVVLGLDPTPAPDPRSTGPTNVRPQPEPSGPTDPRPTTDPSAAIADVVPELDGPGLLGRVRTARDAAVPGAEVVATIVLGAERREAGRARANATGRFALRADLAADPAAADALARIEFDVRASGFQSKRDARGLADLLARAAGRPLTIELQLDPGQDLTGRVVDARGTARAGAEVVLWTPSLRAGAEIERPAASARTGADGRFRLGFTSEGTCALRVRLENEGTAERAPLELGVHGDRDLGDLVLRGSGVLEGVVLHPDGHPATALELWAVPAELAGERDAPRIAATTLTERERGDGLAFTRTFTDETGRFRATGLVPGNYALVAPGARARLEPAAAVRATPATDVRLVLASARVAVRVVDAEGTPVLDAKVACSRLAGAGGGDDDLAPVSTEWRTPRAPHGLAAFDVEPETSYALRAEARGRVAEDLVHLAPGEYAGERTLVLAERAPGALRIAFQLAAGLETPTVRVSLVSALTGDPLDACTERAPSPDGVLDGLPPGRYRVDVDPRGASDALHAFLPARAGEVVAIESGRTTDIVVPLVQGARIELDLALDGPPPADFEFRADPRAHPDEREKARRLHAEARGAIVTLAARAPAGSTPRALVFEADDADPLQHGASSTLLPGRRATAAGVVAPGEYVLHVRAEGFAPAEELVVLRAGETRTVRVLLRAQ